MDAPAPVIPPEHPPGTATHPTPVWRVVLWSLAVSVVVGPPLAVLTFTTAGFVIAAFDLNGSTLADVVGLLMVVIVTLGAVFSFIRRGVRLGWPAQNGRLVCWALLAIVFGCGAWAVLDGKRERRSRLKEKVVLANLRQLAAAEQQWLAEDSTRFFVRYEDLVGPDRSIRNLQIADGEDYHSLFPHHGGATLRLILPKHRPATWPPDGTAASYPDGVHVTQLPDGGTVEATWQNGEMHGPFRAYTKERRLRAEATYTHGRLTGPAWLIDATGHRVDVLAVTR